MLWQAATRRSLLTHAFSHTHPPVRLYLTCFRSTSSSLLRTTTIPPPVVPSHIRLFSLSSLFRPREPPKPTAHASVINHITNLELVADKNPTDVFAQIELFRELVNTQSDAGRKVVLSRWERMCEFDPASPLLRSDEAFQYYLMALVQSDMSSSVKHAVQRRESLMNEHPLQVPVENTAAVTETTLTQLPSSNSKNIAQRVLTNQKSVHGSPLSVASKVGSLQSPMGTAVGAGFGNTTNPIHVSITEQRGATALRFVRFIVLTGLGAFFVMVILAVILENSGLLKAGPKSTEYQPLEGKTVKFSDVHGVDEVKEELNEVVAFLKDPQTFTTLGGKLPKGILLTGPPGTGKTLLARAVAGEAGVPFLFASGSEFDEMFVGVGAKRVRDLFATARKKQPAIIFIDELDAIGGKRKSRDTQYMKQTLNQLLVEMDGFLQSEGVIVIAATNFPESLDDALVRPGRFDRIISVPLPDVRGRVQILRHHMSPIRNGPDVDMMILARGTPGFSGAELENMVNQAAVQASKEGAKNVHMQHYEWAKDRIVMGAERKSHFIDPKVKKMTAYHEGGHALVALFTDGAMPLHKVTCVTRGHALGLTAQLPEDDRVSVSKKEYLAQIDVCMGGRVAEELIYGPDNVTSGATSDLKQATRTASNMVRFFGFSPLVGPVFYGEQDNSISPEKRREIEDEVKRLLEEGEDRVKELLKNKEHELHLLANALVEYETLNAEEVKKIIKGEPIRPVVEVIAQAESEASKHDTSLKPQPQPQPSSPQVQSISS